MKILVVGAAAFSVISVAPYAKPASQKALTKAVP